MLDKAYNLNELEEQLDRAPTEKEKEMIKSYMKKHF